MAPGLTYHEFKKLCPCSGTRQRIDDVMGGAEKWGNNKITAAQAREAGATFNELRLVVCELARSDKDVERRLRLYLADVAAHVLDIYERWSGSDDRPRQAIIAARRFARGEIEARDLTAAMEAARDAAWCTPWDVGDAAWCAALAAAGDADAAVASAWCAVRVDADATSADAEQSWQFDRLIERLSDKEPGDWPLPEKREAA